MIDHISDFLQNRHVFREGAGLTIFKIFKHYEGVAGDYPEDEARI